MWIAADDGRVLTRGNDYLNWESGEPNNAHYGTEHYVHIWAGHNGKWNDANIDGRGPQRIICTKRL